MEKPYRKYFLQTQSRLINYQHEREKSNRTKISSIFLLKKECIKNKRSTRTKTKYQRLYKSSSLWGNHPVKNDWVITPDFEL